MFGYVVHRPDNIVNNLFKIAMRGYCIIIVTVR